MRKTFQYRLFPNKAQEQTLLFWLRRCCDLYNACLEESKAAWTMQGKSLSAFDQINELPDLKAAFPAYQELPSHVLQDVIRRHAKAKQAFFQRVAVGEKPGYPRYKTMTRYRSLTFPDQAGWKLEAKHLVFTPTKNGGTTGLGRMRIKLHRPLEGKIKTLTIKRDIDQWFALFSCEVADLDPLTPSETTIGLDLGVLRFATLSDGTQIENPRWYRKQQATIARLDTIKNRRVKQSKRHKRAAIALAKAHRKVRNQRKDFHHRVSRQLINTYQTIVMEDLAIKNMTKAPEPKPDPEKPGQYLPNGAAAKGGLNKSILDAAWGQFQLFTVYKAESAGRQVVLVDPRNTSQRCSGCGELVHKELDERTHRCPFCGLVLDRDHNGAICIFQGWKSPTAPGLDLAAVEVHSF
jgi:putative transposase